MSTHSYFSVGKSLALFGIAVREFLKLAKSQFPSCPQPAPWIPCSGVMMKAELFQVMLLGLHLQVQIFIPFFLVQPSSWEIIGLLITERFGLEGTLGIDLILPGCLGQSVIL